MPHESINCAAQFRKFRLGVEYQQGTFRFLWDEESSSAGSPAGTGCSAYRVASILRTCLPTFQHCLQFLEPDWLAEIVVHPGGKTLLAVSLHGTGSDGNNVNRKFAIRVLT